ncbi:thiamine-phosphate kinase [Croceicoccus ponticola]|uniref:Thiamine-monophosphate kinase n=1 Tax=Croceicoccus ponticola TaxID=2217664 RepID=A0A437GVP5_9SPHN|nr:thiamine-phosphate kinase [Croceicoccus ponticola]RVQ65977.1 thiamine-phosphate kinase [Croceicoccus ponticola]
MTATAAGASGEERFIAALRSIATDPAARGLADDAAELKVGGATLIVTHDMMVEGVHWLRGQDMADVAWKLVAVNLSDLAAKAARPVALMLGYTLGDAREDARFAEGLREAVTTFGVPLLGGDTVAAPSGSARAVGLTAIGEATATPSPARADAKAGEALWVTGTIGNALAGYEALVAGDFGPASLSYRRPRPRIAEGLALAGIVSAMMDISDGLLLDASRMADASGTTIAIDCAAVPIHPALTDRALEAMTWGDDYQLLFTLLPGAEPPVTATRIGIVHPRGVHALLLDGAPLPMGQVLGYRHTNT